MERNSVFSRWRAMAPYVWFYKCGPDFGLQRTQVLPRATEGVSHLLSRHHSGLALFHRYVAPRGPSRGRR